MEIIEVDKIFYEKSGLSPYHIFSSGAFNALNAGKCDKVVYLLFKDTKIRLGIIFGIRGKQLYSPFSAPFGGFIYAKEDVRLQVIDEALDQLKAWATASGYEGIQLTQPPSIYETSFLAKMSNCLYRANFQIVKNDLNYAFELEKFDENYSHSIWRNARKNLNAAFKNDFSFALATEVEEKERVFKVIKQNREERGFPLRMNWEQITETMQVVDADFFSVKEKDGRMIAGAMVFKVSEGIAQVIYWGDLPDFAHLKTMNFLSYKVFDFYKASKIEVLDIGPSTENSIPNFGLCEFKESIGCSLSTKLSFSYTF